MRTYDNLFLQKNILLKRGLMPRTPLISVIMSIYNGEKYLDQALCSILNQTLSNIEFIIIDDGSTDSTKKIISSYIDDRIKFIQNTQNIGLAASLNKGISIARGKYIARMDSDDVSYPERLAKQYSVMEGDQKIDLTGTSAIAISELDVLTGKLPMVLGHKAICSKPWRGFYLAHPTWMARREWLHKYKYAIPQSYYSEDQELLLRSFEESKFACLPEVLFAYRIRSKVSMYKLLKARWAVLGFQKAYFISRRKFYFMTLAVIVFFLRIIKDVINFVLVSISLNQITKDSFALSQEDRNKWVFVKTTIERDIKRLQS